MKFTLSWLKQFLETENTLDEIATALTDIGFEVEEIIDRSEELKDFEVAHIIKTSPHPSADKLQICEVESAKGILQIVCGASNARANLKVVLANVGTIIPNGNFKIKGSEIRGIKSLGMLCSEEELLISESSSGIIELSQDAKVGVPFAKYYGLDDPIIHIDVTPNRGDALSVYGIARDLAAKGLGTLKAFDIPQVNTDFNTEFSIKVEDPHACKFFAAREIKNLKNCESPDWLKKFLNNIGIGSISAIVDVTNYILYTYGQPMHAYDKSKLVGNNLNIKILKDSFKFTALNNKEYELSAGDLVINDSKSVQCLAGIIGADVSACDMSTTTIIIEAANFSPKIITKSGRKHNIITDSRHRFERNVDSSFTSTILDLATTLITSICDGLTSQVLAQGNPEVPLRTVDFPLNFFTKLTGLEVQPQIIRDILLSLGFKIEFTEDIFKLTIPSWRPDIEVKEDIVEEIMRIYGYDKLPSVKLPEVNVEKILSKEQRRISDIKRILAATGFVETVNWSFVDKNLAKLFSSIKPELALQNPISLDLNYMRPSIILSLLKIASKNSARSVKDLSLFEVGPVFNGVSLEDEKTFACGIRAGYDNQKSSHAPTLREVDVFDIKADIELVLNSCGLSLDRLQIRNNAAPPYYHPTRSASIQMGSNILGYFGQIHPTTLKAFDVDVSIYGFELNLTNIPHGKNKFGLRDEFKFSDFQSVVRDFAFTISADQNIGEILSFVKNIDKKLIRAVDLFDVYTGSKVEAGSKSIAMSVNIQADDKTLTEAELALLSNLIITSVEQKFKASLRM